MTRLVNELGMKYGRLTVTERSGWLTNGKTRCAAWTCVCLCGNSIIVRGSDLRKGSIVSCTCWRDENSSKQGLLNTTHGHSRPTQVSSTYVSWNAMNNRCSHPVGRSKSYYAVKVCLRWKTFENFLIDLGIRPKGTTLGRKNDTGNYEMGNAWWMTPIEQLANRKCHQQ